MSRNFVNSKILFGVLIVIASALLQVPVSLPSPHRPVDGWPGPMHTMTCGCQIEPQHCKQTIVFFPLPTSAREPSLSKPNTPVSRNLSFPRKKPPVTSSLAPRTTSPQDTSAPPPPGTNCTTYPTPDRYFPKPTLRRYTSHTRISDNGAIRLRTKPAIRRWECAEPPILPVVIFEPAGIWPFHTISGKLRRTGESSVPRTVWRGVRSTGREWADGYGCVGAADRMARGFWHGRIRWRATATGRVGSELSAYTDEDVGCAESVRSDRSTYHGRQRRGRADTFLLDLWDVVTGMRHDIKKRDES